MNGPPHTGAGPGSGIGKSAASADTGAAGVSACGPTASAARPEAGPAVATPGIPASGKASRSAEPVCTAAAGESVAEAWRRARSAGPGGHLDAAGCNVPSDRVVNTMAAHLRLEREVGGYAAAPDQTVPKAGLAALVGARAQDVAYVESGTAATAALLGGWALPAGARIGVTRAEYGATVALLCRLAVRHRWRLVDIPLDGDSRVDLAGLRSILVSGLDLLVLSHISSHRGVVQPAQAVGALCRAAGVPLVVDVCQSLGHVETRGIGATAYIGTSRKWLAGPRGVGFLILPGASRDFGGRRGRRGERGHAGLGTNGDRGEPSAAVLGASGDFDRISDFDGPPDVPDTIPCPHALCPADRFESYEGAIAARVGFGSAVLEHHALGPEAVHACLAAAGAAARGILDGAGGWRVAEPLGEPSAIVTLRPPPGTDPEETQARAAEAALLIGLVPTSRAPSDMTGPLLRVSPSPGTRLETLRELADVLRRRC
ncbi:aminotransferase class V-fold PLP-dependent enzyme [Sinosporangium siamense]|uniref:Aminotransferase class V domain-containing protein n=1 Tax=Sinosporangium siamense TaxID=1367973 RepID=A0A919RIA3_9ACTN|nr:aminotransferase class V-fold PLP-dependent enzyme [Sinosporangium siamense]GII92349.1 hypothetical protein Ssi02_25800 [Sinosporangium siamense]